MKLSQISTNEILQYYKLLSIIIRKQVQIDNTQNHKHNFIEQFEDSEQVNNDAGGAGPIGMDQDGYPIQLIRIRPSGKVEVDQKALQIISSCDLPVGFVALAGKYRTGKSFLLNKLLYLQGKGFRVDPSTAACTQGIWMWSKPVYNDKLNNYLFFIDTEGSQSLSKDAENDTKIFVLTILISSYFIYNSVGSIDEKSINQLNLVTKLSMNILAEENIRTKDNEDILYRFMPKFLWILRDFTLELKNQDGKRLTAKEYLEDCLLDQNNLIKANEDSRKIRRAIVNNFKERDCITLVRPAKEERDLQMLNELPEHALRRQFIDGVNQLRDKILKEAGPKVYQDSPLYGNSIASMIQSYVQSMNTNGFPTIKTAWQGIAEDQGTFAYNKALEKYNQIYLKHFSEDQPKGEQLHKILINLRDETLTQFNRNISQPNQLYNQKLKQFLASKQQAIIEVNRQLNDCRNIEILKSCASNLLRKIQANQYANKPNEINKDIEQVMQEYKLKAKGETKGEILSQFLTNMSPIILEIQRPKVEKQNEALKNIEKQEYEAKIKLMEQKMKALENQLTNMKDQNTIMAKNQAAMKSDPKKDRKKGSTGCCGGDGCFIM